ncbi:MAG TPA: hypothetical protein VK620_27625 [Bradyrhizobium sp.]|nr:hypothetical protein [Bradyrhizobium sp.]
MSLASLQTLLQAENSDALAGMKADKLSSERAKSLDYYMGNMTRDMPTETGRSAAVSSDVSDTIEGMMPALMEIFCSGEEVVTFNAVGEEDEPAAEQETDYVNHVFMQQNPGFLILYSFIKDALLSKLGIVKCWWETKDITERETYQGLDDTAYGILIDDPDIEVVEHTEYPAPQMAMPGGMATQ